MFKIDFLTEVKFLVPPVMAYNMSEAYLKYNLFLIIIIIIIIIQFSLKWNRRRKFLMQFSRLNFELNFGKTCRCGLDLKQ
jgi:hypothetical protein